MPGQEVTLANDFTNLVRTFRANDNTELTDDMSLETLKAKLYKFVSSFWNFSAVFLHLLFENPIFPVDSARVL